MSKTLSYKELPKVPSLPTPGSGYLGVTVCLTTDGKPYYCDGVTWADLSLTGGGGGGLTPTSIKTTNYTASVNDLVRVNSTSASFTITLPGGPADGSNIAILDVTNACGGFAVLVTPSNGNTIENDTIGIQIDVSGAYVSLLYNSSTTNWKLEDTYVNTEMGFDNIHNFLLMGA
jgi:hypothetical protein